MVELSSLQQQTLRFLKTHPLEQFYLRQLAGELGVDPGNLSREIKRLVGEDLLVKRKEGNQVYFSLNPKEMEEVDRHEFLKDSHLRLHLKELEPEMVKLAQSLIRIRSVSAKDPEEKIAEYISRRAREFGLVPRVVAKDKRRPNVVVDLDDRPDKEKPFFLLVGHMDTVGVEDIDTWRYYPFSGHKAGGRIYGRGAQDMKAGIACELCTLKAIKDLKLELPVVPRLLLVSNEEGGSTATPIFDQGMEYLIEEGFAKGVGAIYGYGGSYNVGIGHRGVLRVKVVVHGEEAHTGGVKTQKKVKGANAVTAMAEILLTLEKLKIPQTKHPSFPKHSNILTAGTMILHGGSTVGMVPGYCESVVEVRYLPGFKIRDFYNRIKETSEEIARRRGVTVEMERFVNIPAVSLPPNEPLVATLQRSIESVYSNKITARGTGPANESFMLINKGIPTVVFGPLGGGAHSDNESIVVSSLVKTVQVYLLVMLGS